LIDIEPSETKKMAVTVAETLKSFGQIRTLELRCSARFVQSKHFNWAQLTR
jgi:hypothetical protein